MDNIVVITQNVKLDSLHLIRNKLKGQDTLVFSTQLVFDNEAKIIQEQLGVRCVFTNFSQIMDDSDFEKCDIDAYSDSLTTATQYYSEIRRIKNQIAVDRLLNKYPCNNRLIVCDDLGIDDEPWLERGFIRVKCEYYHSPEPSSPVRNNMVHRLSAVFKTIKRFYDYPIFISYYKGQKHLFFGSLNRIGYRCDISFSEASKWENIKFILGYYWFKFFKSFPKNDVIRMSTIHESNRWPFPHHPNYNTKIIQDGYLPPNYSSKYLLFHGPYVEFYTWDTEGCKTFIYHNLKNRVLPFRKKLYLPKPVFPKNIRKILCVASGAGDWTALKNRSDEDSMMVAFGKVAAMFPEIEFVYRCHPVWIHPQHQGVNSINRAAEYIHWLGLPNLKLSSNIPNAEEDGRFRLSYQRSSFEEDLKDVDIVFGEHSISMIDAAFKGILFCSVNVTGRRDLFEGITGMGFPHCESIEEIESLLDCISTESFKDSYEKAIDRYNCMTNEE